ncbi:hypothetical protein L1887_51916 [Cichorium endivia]|nr:hypothetical protein L1887_51916 [Cichorium endivia]
MLRRSDCDVRAVPTSDAALQHCGRRLYAEDKLRCHAPITGLEMGLLTAADRHELNQFPNDDSPPIELSAMCGRSAMLDGGACVGAMGVAWCRDVCRIGYRSMARIEQHVATYMLGNLDGEEEEGPCGEPGAASSISARRLPSALALATLGLSLSPSEPRGGCALLQPSRQGSRGETLARLAALVAPGWSWPTWLQKSTDGQKFPRSLLHAAGSTKLAPASAPTGALGNSSLAASPRPESAATRRNCEPPQLAGMGGERAGPFLDAAVPSRRARVSQRRIDFAQMHELEQHSTCLERRGLYHGRTVAHMPKSASLPSTIAVQHTPSRTSALALLSAVLVAAPASAAAAATAAAAASAVVVVTSSAVSMELVASFDPVANHWLLFWENRERLDKLIEELNGKDINTLIAEGQEKLASVPAGGAAPAAAAGGAAAAAGGAAAAKEEEKEEEKEESDDDMGFVEIMIALLSLGVTVLHSVEAMLGGKIGAVQMRAGTMVTGPHKRLERRLEMGHHQPRHALHKSTTALHPHS